MRLIVLLCFCVLALAAQKTPPAAGLIITNANVWTGDPKQPHAQAVAIAGDRIIAVGATAQVNTLRGPKTRVIDSKSKLVLPGFNDAHVHFMQGGMQLDQVDLKDAATPEEFARRIGERAKARPGEWVLGGDWDEQRWPGAPLPARDLIDRVAPKTPVFVNRYDGHMAVANSAALAAAKVTAATKDPPGGEIVRDAKGRPTGVLKDAAMDYVYKIIPPATRAQKIAALHRAIAHAASLGVTTVQDMGTSPDDLALYEELAKRGELTLRIYAVPPIETPLDRASPLRRTGASFQVRVQALKGFADGSLGSTTAYFLEPYADAPNTRGLLMHPLVELQKLIRNGDRAGIQMCIHAIGDAAISDVLDMFAETASENGARDRRFRIEHSQHVAPRDFERYAKLGVIASVEPYHAIDDGRWAERRIGPERIKTTYAFRTFLDHGVKLALGTDWTVAPLNPMLTIYAAVTRATLDGKHPNGWVPEQKLTVEEAVRAYTAGSAYAEFQERDKGTISPGKLADVVILGRNIFQIPPAEIKDVQVETTIMGGRLVYTR